jgi:hypothetical protein
MEVFINLAFALSVISGIFLFLLTLYVVHFYEVKTKRRPPTFNFWPFLKEFKEVFPNLSRVGGSLTIFSFLALLPKLIEWIAAK